MKRGIVASDQRATPHEPAAPAGSVAGADHLTAARAAFARRDWDDAYRLFVASDERPRLDGEDLEMLAETARWSRRFAEVVALLERAEAAYLARGDVVSAARVALQCAVEHHTRASMTVAVGCILRARTLLEGASEGPVHAFLEWCLGRGGMDGEDLVTARRHLENAIELARRHHDRDVEALAKHDLGHLLVTEGDPAAGQALVDEAVALALSGALKLNVAGIIYCGTIWACRNRGDFQRAAEWTEVSTRWCAREAVSGFPGLCRAHRAEILRLHGDLASAEREASAAGEELEKAYPAMAGFAWREIGDARLRRGDLKGAADAYRQCIALGTDPQPGLALLRLTEGNPEAARRALAPSLASDQYLVRSNKAYLLPAWTTVLLACGDLDGARGAAQELDALATSFGTGTVTAAALCAGGEVALAESRYDDALELLRRAWQVWCDHDQPYEAARARMLLADVHAALGDDAAADLELEAARQVYERLGAAHDEQLAAARLARKSSADVAEERRRVRATFLFTDIVRSTELVEAMGDEAWGYLRAWHDKALRACFAQHRGEEIDHTGDGFFVSFAAARDAIACAVAIQRTLDEHRREHGFAPQVRIGAHAAEVSQRGDERTGRGVHEAARIANAAGAGEILVSEATFREADAGVPGTPPRPLALKGLSTPIDVVAVTWRA